MRKTVTIRFDFGEEVRLKTDPEKMRVVTRIILTSHDKQYELASEETTSWHFEGEIEPIKVIKVKGFGKE